MQQTLALLRVDLEQTHAAHAEKTLQNLDSRRQRLDDEERRLVIPDLVALSELDRELVDGEGEMARQEALLAQLEAAHAELDEQRERAMGELQTLERELSAMDAKLLSGVGS